MGEGEGEGEGEGVEGGLNAGGGAAVDQAEEREALWMSLHAAQARADCVEADINEGAEEQLQCERERQGGGRVTCEWHGGGGGRQQHTHTPYRHAAQPGQSLERELKPESSANESKTLTASNEGLHFPTAAV